MERLGGGWVAEEALAIATYCFLAAEYFVRAIVLGANHSGDSDSTASIAGQLYGGGRANRPSGSAGSMAWRWPM